MKIGILTFHRAHNYGAQLQGMNAESSARSAEADASDLQSAVIDWLRLPLAVAVVFIHSFGSPAMVDMTRLHEDPGSWQSVYDFVRIAGSNVVTHCAVPAFFLFSGFLFFYKVSRWDLSVYRQKLRRRVRTLFLPYLLWIGICVVHAELWNLGGVLMHGKPLSVMSDYLISHGGVNMLWDSNIWGGG